MSKNSNGKFGVTLKDLKLHPILTENSELLASIQYSLNSIKDLSHEALHWLLVFHPIFVIKEPEGYQVICGARVFNIAARLLPQSTLIYVRLVENVPYENILAGIYADLFLTPLAFSMHQAPQTLMDIYKLLPDKTAKSFTPDLASNKARFAKSLGVSTNTLYYRKAKYGEKK